MRKLSRVLLLIFILFPFLQSNAQQTFSIHGKFDTLSSDNVGILVYKNGMGVHIDTIPISDGEFLYKGNTFEPQKAYLYVTHDGHLQKNFSNYDNTSLYLEKGNIEIYCKDSLKNALRRGTALNNDLQEFTNVMRPLTLAENILNEKIETSAQNHDSTNLKKINLALKSLNEKEETIVFDFIKTHNNSIVSLNLIHHYFDPFTHAEKAKLAFSLLNPSVYQSTREGRALAASLNISDNFGVGSVAPDFTAKTISGQSVSLSSFKGKYVLVDFWASWCGPCREESPNLVKAYKDLKSKNFVILGFSLDKGDDGKAKWQEAIKKDGLTWTQVSDLEGLASNIASKYRVGGIPANFLVDPSGKIIATDLRGPELEESLKKYISVN